MEDICINDIAVNFFTTLLYETSVTHLPNGLCATFLFLPHSDFMYDLLLNRRQQHGIYLLNIFQI